MKTTPMKHQAVGTKLLAENPEYYGLGAEQGTGKTWMLLADLERAYEAGEVDALAVLAPKGVHTNWTRREIPAHVELETDSIAWVAGPGVRAKRELRRLLTPDKIRGDLPVLAMNIDAVNTPTGQGYLRNFLRKYRCMFVLDESSRIKNPAARRTKRVLSLATLAASRRIASGTMMPNGPPDLFAQMEFLCPDGKLLGTTSYRAFVAEYAQLLPRNHGQMKHVIEGIARRKRKKMEEIPDAWLPQLVARDAMGAPLWKNLEKLQAMLKPHVFRVLKKDCLDLPEKIYQTYGFTMPSSQRGVYAVAEEQLRFERDNGELDIFNALTKIMKLRQIVSGFIMLDGEATELPALKDNPRMKLFLELVDDLDGQFIVWATFREELAQIAQALRDLDITCVEYHGGVKTKDRETAVDDFQDGRARAFVGQAQSGGLGLTLTAAETAIYYSNDYNSETRLQSEDRCHRIGTEHNVLYIDIVAEGTIDERIIAALRRKEDVANTVLNYI